MLTIPAVWAEECLAHEPDAEIWLGVRTAGTEVPERATILRDAVVGAGARLVPAAPHGDEVLASVHDPKLLEHLAGVYAAWEQAGFPDYPGQNRVVPYIFPTPALLDGAAARL